MGCAARGDSRRFCVIIRFFIEETRRISRELVFCLEGNVVPVSREHDVAVDGGPIDLDSAVSKVLEDLVMWMAILGVVRTRDDRCCSADLNPSRPLAG
ncbi:hypothetical protein B2G88_19035 [Natronolimnobius baerhuensis]|uniref:Uncharacterized protein n=1 Tax=Natronolimnobius baerhuensis TaxID=253108 RepID=A0A202E3K4_9EURY|nr:hypothetical protein B2G88_19035 [Natronolimnobius baerhuensis]